MKHHDDPLFALLAEVNPAADTDEPSVDVMSSESLLDVIDERIGAMRNTNNEGAERSGTANRWRGPAVAVAVMAVAVVIAIPAMLFLGGDDSGSDPGMGAVSTVTTSVTVPDAPDQASDVVSQEYVINSWDPILATTVAGTAPAAVTCPVGSTPDIAGDPEQARPGEGPWNNQAAVFDTARGRIVLVDADGVTWGFDVCTNAWTRLADDDDRVHAENPMVYDIDSDRVISFGQRGVWFLDIEANAWVPRSDPVVSPPFGDEMIAGAVYDPVSGLVMVAAGNGTISSYDIDADVWTTVGELWCSRRMVYDVETEQWVPAPPEPGCGRYLVGHSRATDDLVLMGFQDDGALVDGRTGAIAPVGAPDVGIAGGFGSFSYAVGGDTAYTFGHGNGQGNVCRLDTETGAWTCIEIEAPMPAAMVFDPINERVVVINDFCCNWPGTAVGNEVLAVDFTSGRVIELLASNQTRIAD